MAPTMNSARVRVECLVWAVFTGYLIRRDGFAQAAGRRC